MTSGGAGDLLAGTKRRALLGATPLVERLAVRGPFDPEEFHGAQDLDEVLRLLCTRTGSEHLLHDEPRISALAAMLRRGGLAEVARRRREMRRTPRTTPLQRMLDVAVLSLPARLDEFTEDDLVASLTVWQWLTEAIARARLSTAIAVQPRREEVEERLAVLDLTRAVRRLVAGGCVGRDAELARLHDYRTTPPRGGLAADPAMVVHGVGGVGKSTLIAQFVTDLAALSADGPPPIWAYLDLDRPTLSAYDPWTILREIIRQAGAHFPDHQRAFGYLQTIANRRTIGSGAEAASDRGSVSGTVREFASILASAGGGTLVVVLDTFEEVQRRPSAVVDKIFELFADLADALPHLRLIVSGRAPAEIFADPARPDRQLAVQPLGDDAAAQLLNHFVRREAPQGRPTSEALSREIVDLVGGIPLTLRLAARVLIQEGPDAVADAARRASVLDRMRSEYIRGFLYQRILDHLRPVPGIPEDLLRAVAKSGLVLRQLTAALIDDVVLPALTEPTPPHPPARRILDALANEVALVDRAGGLLRLREEVRVPALAALRYDDPSLEQRVRDRAISYYQGVPGRGAEVELAYHRLMSAGTGFPDEVADIDEDVLRELKPSLADLPPSAANEIRSAIGIPATVPLDRRLVQWERRVLPQVERALRAGDLTRARELLGETNDRTAFTPLYRLQSRIDEAAGDLAAAAENARRELDIALLAADSERCSAAALHAAALAERRGRISEAIAILSDTERGTPLAGRPDVRLELLLNRMNLGERRNYDDEETRWSLELDARTLLRRFPADDIGLTTVLIRLLAAALGRTEPQRLRDAAGQIGVGHDEDPARVVTLVRAIADWDAQQQQPGGLARACRLTGGLDARNQLEATWNTAISGLGTEAGPLLDRLWSLQRPPETVREALRAIYVWWNIPSGERPNPIPESEVRLGDESLDLTGPRMRRLEEDLREAYPTSTHARTLVDRAGLDPADINWNSSASRLTREILTAAVLSGRTSALISAVLEDPSAISVHADLRDLVGPRWLRENSAGP